MGQVTYVFGTRCVESLLRQLQFVRRCLGDKHVALRASVEVLVQRSVQDALGLGLLVKARGLKLINYVYEGDLTVDPAIHLFNLCTPAQIAED